MFPRLADRTVSLIELLGGQPDSESDNAPSAGFELSVSYITSATRRGSAVIPGYSPDETTQQSAQPADFRARQRSRARSRVG